MNYYEIGFRVSDSDILSILIKSEDDLVKDKSPETIQKITSALALMGISDTVPPGCFLVEKLVFTELESIWDEILQGKTLDDWEAYEKRYMEVTRQNEIIHGAELIIFRACDSGKPEGEVHKVTAFYIADSSDDKRKLIYEGFDQDFVPTEVYHWYPWGQLFVLHQIAHLAQKNMAPTVDMLVERFKEVDSVNIGEVFDLVVKSISSGDIDIVRYHKYYFEEKVVGFIREGKVFEGESYLRGLLQRHKYDSSYVFNLRSEGFIEALEPAHHGLRPLYITGTLRELETLYEQKKAEQETGVMQKEVSTEVNKEEKGIEE